MSATDPTIAERILETISPDILRVFDRHGEVEVLTGEINPVFLDTPDGDMGSLAREGWFAVEATAPTIRGILKLRSRWRRRFAAGSRVVVFDVQHGVLFGAMIEEHYPLSLSSPTAAYFTASSYCDFRSDGVPWTLPPHLLPQLPMIAAFELDVEAWPIYRDWCQENWPERALHI